MELLSILKKVSGSTEFVESGNYYYEHHQCKDGDVKVMLDFTLSNDMDDSILRFGICPHCGKCFYHKDFESKGF